MAIVKKVGIKDSDTSTTVVKDIGVEAQNVIISYDSSGNVIEDITQSGVTVSSTKSAAKAIKDINTELGGKANTSDLTTKADLISGKVPASQLPSYVDDVIEGYYNAVNGKFYEEAGFITEIPGERGKVYVDLTASSMYRWDNSFIEILNSTNMALTGLTNVSISGTPQNNESLVYDSTELKWVNKKAGGHMVQVPTVVVGTYTYNGSAQGPTISNLDSDFYSYVNVTGATAIDAGSYVLRFSLKNSSTTTWSDLTTADKTYNWSIDKAAGSVTLASNSVTLDDDHKVVSVGFSGATGDVSVSSDDTDIATVAISGSDIVITATEATGNATITVSVAASANYNAGSGSIAVIANFLVIKSFNLATDAELKDMLDAYYNDEITLAEMGWHVGDTRLMHFNEMDAPSPQAAGSKWAAQDITIQIVATEHTDLATSINGHTKACITVQTRECMNNNSSSLNQNGHIYVNGDSSYDMTFTKWSNLYIRTYLNSTVLGAIPSGDFKSSIKQSKHYRLTTNGNNPMTIFTTDGSHTDRTVEQVTDTLFLPSYTEMFGNIRENEYPYYLGGGVPNSEEGTQFEWYETKNNRIKYGNNNGSSNNIGQLFWFSSPGCTYDSNYGYFWYALSATSSTPGNPSPGNRSCALAPAFAM